MKVSELLPNGLRLCLSNPTVLDGLMIYLIRSRTKIRHSSLSRLKGAIGCLIVNDSGIQAVEIYRTSDLFSVYFESIISSYNSSPDRTSFVSNVISLDLIEKWWDSVITTHVNIPNSVLLDQTIQIQNKGMIGSLVLYRGSLLHFTCYFVEPAAKPQWMIIRDSRPFLRSSLLDAEDTRRSRQERRKSYKIAALGGFSSEQASGILELNDSWIRFVCYKGQEATLIEDASFKKSDYPSRNYFYEVAGKYLPYYRYLTRPLTIPSLRFEDILSVCRTNFPDDEADTLSQCS